MNRLNKLFLINFLFASILIAQNTTLNQPVPLPAESRQFDFWVGEWEVFNHQNKKAGESIIEKILRHAVILENWTGASGYVGKSFNHFNKEKGKWIQYWVDQNSDPILFEGNYDETQKAMIFFSYDHAKDKENPYIRKLTFYNLDPNTVRQFSQQSSDEGKTWNVEYDFTYKRK